MHQSVGSDVVRVRQLIRVEIVHRSPLRWIDSAEVWRSPVDSQQGRVPPLHGRPHLGSQAWMQHVHQLHEAWPCRLISQRQSWLKRRENIFQSYNHFHETWATNIGNWVLHSGVSHIRWLNTNAPISTRASLIDEICHIARQFNWNDERTQLRAKTTSSQDMENHHLALEITNCH